MAEILFFQSFYTSEIVAKAKKKMWSFYVFLTPDP